MFTKECIILYVCSFFLGICAIQIINNIAWDNSVVDEDDKYIANSEKDIIDRCSNLSLNESGKCLVEEIRKFYNYTSIKGDVAISLKQIQETGGDCSSYSFLYERLGKGLGFESTTKLRLWEKDIFAGHRVAFIWDDKYYCKLDLNKYFCKERLDYEE